LGGVSRGGVAAGLQVGYVATMPVKPILRHIVSDTKWGLSAISEKDYYVFLGFNQPLINRCLESTFWGGVPKTPKFDQNSTFDQNPKTPKCRVLHRIHVRVMCSIIQPFSLDDASCYKNHKSVEFFFCVDEKKNGSGLIGD